MMVMKNNEMSNGNDYWWWSSNDINGVKLIWKWLNNEMILIIIINV